MEKIIIPPSIQDQLIPGRPLLIVDADEVLLQFVKALEHYLNRTGYYIQFDSFQLSGNIRAYADDQPIDQSMTGKLIGDFFTHDVEKVDAVPGAIDGLRHLKQHYQIIILSNVPFHVEERRQQHLINLGMDYPLIANKGGKGAFAKELSNFTGAKTVFIDDLPPQHTSVAEHADHIHRVHMIADERLAKLIKRAEDAHARIDQWEEATPYLIKHLSET